MRFSFHLTITLWYLLLANTTFAYTHQDTLRGSNGEGRRWWDVKHYNLTVYLDPENKSLSGFNIIRFDVIDKPIDVMQIDLQDTLVVDSVYVYDFDTVKSSSYKTEVVVSAKKANVVKDDKVWWLHYGFSKWPVGANKEVKIYYHGKPRVARTPPWDGGIIWGVDSMGSPWYSVACQGLGASSWWPCKDYQADEPDEGMLISVSPKAGKMTVISNGTPQLDVFKSRINVWEVKNPINTYNATFYGGAYVGWTDTLMGEKGKLDLSFYVLRQNEAKAKKQFEVTKQMLHCFEYWMGPYPFYEDGYKLVEAPFLGMEHQSAVAYGNQYKMGYLGQDRSGTGVGSLFDFIIVHESGHEWFGNNITAADIADNWLHEGFTTYTEALFAECLAGKEKAFTYTRGEWKNIRNDVPVIGAYGVQDDGSSDKYDKGAAVVHMIRVMMNDDEKFRQLLRGLNKDFYHKIVTSKQVEDYIIKFTGLDLKAFFDQYLRSTQIPKLEWYIKKKELSYRFTNTIPGFSLSLPVYTNKKSETLRVTSEWQSISWRKGGYNISVSPDFLIKE
ncbi:MAG TPA: M1 family metallopeptidase [Flavipsychrobacter sp.]|nr:M1 family metallopeptidase [Flavipsychrobacter sp.]